MVQRYADELKNNLPEVDAFIGLDQLDQVVQSTGIEARDAWPAGDLPLLSPGSRAAGPTATAAWGPSTYLYDETTPRSLATPSWTAYVKIAEGCDHTCAFCAIPSFRGSFRSRDLESIRAEAQALSERGVREVSLIAQDSSHYGRDIGLTEGLAALLTGLNGIEALRWIRLHYLYPNTITQKLIDTMAALPSVVDYVDLPLQHAHPDVLKRMRRGGSGEAHLKLLDRFRAAMPDGALRSTFIVGFPGETDDEFEALLDFVATVRFDHLGVFTYSHEESTPAHRVEDDVPEELKEERRGRLMELQREIAAEANEHRVGRTVEVLVEGAHPETEHLLVGRTRGQALDVDGQVLINDGQAVPGSFVRVELTEVAGYDLVGRIVDA
jgi:ribosomal protein S12 methylthiotransferase